MNLTKLRVRLWTIKQIFLCDLREWIARHAPLLPVEKPTPPHGAFCPACHHLLTRICAVDTGDGWMFFWECEEGCGAAEEFVEEWYPFRFGAYCNEKELRSVGIEVV